MTNANPLVDFLAAYGPQPSSNNLYDEFVVEAAKKTGCAPIEISQPLTEKLVDMLNTEPKTVILTGTAGDGKTYTARKVAEALYGEAGAWGGTEKIFELDSGNSSDSRIRFIKDLSELNAADKKDIYPAITASLRGQGDSIFVVCVNDGHLLKFFRDHQGEDRELHDRIADMLQRDERNDPDGNFLLIHMSRNSHRRLVEEIVDSVVDHDRWSDCGGCPALTDAENPCPIRCNLEVLRSKEPASLRARIKDLVRISAADGRHLSIRQLILLSVNILLGDAESSGLLTCQKARERAADGSYNATNPYTNAFGANLNERERRKYDAFSALAEFNVGHETNNHFDQELLWNDDILSYSPVYGERVFSLARERYRADPVRNVDSFRKGMISQRRRLFFSSDPGEDAVGENPQHDPWNLTAFKHGAAYIAMANETAAGRMPKAIAKSLFRGLNRMMTGEMTNTDDQLWLIASSGVFRGREIPLLVDHADLSPRGACVISFQNADENGEEEGENGKAPVLRFKTRADNAPPVDLPLRPTLFECLLRISEGALPASFSTECHREVERFQLHAASAVHADSEGKPPPPKEVNMDYATGKLQAQTIPIMSGEE